MKKKLPSLNSDEAAERFVATADLSEYDLSGMEMVRFEFQPKTERVNMRLPRPLLDAVKAAAVRAGMPYQRFIRQARKRRSVLAGHDDLIVRFFGTGILGALPRRTGLSPSYRSAEANQSAVVIAHLGDHGGSGVCGRHSGRVAK